MPKLVHKVPAYRLHRPSGQAVVTLNGRDHYLGEYDSVDSQAEYKRLIAEWAVGNRQLPNPDPQNGSSDFTVNELFVAYWDHARQYYVKDGRPTSQIGQIRLAAAPLTQLYGRTPVAAFGPKALKAVRQRLIDRNLSLLVVNQFTGIVKRMFKWAVENELAPSSVWHGLQAVPGLRRGRSAARETEPIRPVAEHLIRAVAPFLSRQVRAMIDLQLVTAMRPGEVTSMRGCDLDSTGKIWLYRPASHKTEHHGKQRLIHLGPRAQKIVKRWLRNDLTAYLFSPRDSEEERHAEQREARQSPMTPSQAQRRPKPHPRRAPGARYTKDSYCRAIQRACAQAFPVPAGLTDEQVKQWRKEHCWSPNQLRHNAATFLRKQYGLDAARVILGHGSPVVTEIYAELDHAKAMQIMAEVG